MIPTFTIVTTLITIGITALLIGILVRINNPQRQRDQHGNGGAPLYVDGGGSSRRQDQDCSDGGDSGGGDSGGSDSSGRGSDSGGGGGGGD
jgi:hypothetical protein